MDNGSNPDKPLSSNLLSIGFRKFADFIGYTGLLFITYGIVSTVTGNRWPLFEEYAVFFSNLLTLIGVFITTLSVYFYTPNIHKPERFSVFVVAPLVIISCLVAIIFLSV